MNKNKIIHLLITTKCDRNCKYCCNKQYDLSKVPVATKEELENAEMFLLTGGEPVKYGNFEFAAMYLHKINPFAKIILYANANEFLEVIIDRVINNDAAGLIKFRFLDGVSLSIKEKRDLYAFNILIKEKLIFDNIKSNRVYVFDNLIPPKLGDFELIMREWQENFKPAEDSIFRRLWEVME